MDSESPSPYKINSDGWGVCSFCGRMIKGLNEPATHRVMGEHLLNTHSFKLTDPDQPTASIGAPMFIPPRRNGSGIMRSLRTNYGDGPDAVSPATLKRLSSEVTQ